MKGIGKRLCVLFFIMCCFMLNACSEFQNYRPIENINNLDGRRVGVGIGYSSDYLLTNRDDMKLMRYNSSADMITALCYRRLDAVAVEKASANQIISSVSGLRIVDPPIQKIGFVTYIANSRPDLYEAFNKFANEFKKTEDYADLIKRVNAMGEYQEKYVEPIGKGETISVVVTSDAYPYTYLDFETGEIKGSDIEYITHFANKCGYNVELHSTDYTSMELCVIYEKYDMGITGICDVWREDVETGNRALVSDIYMDTDVVFVEVEDFDKLEILQAIEE